MNAGRFYEDSVAAVETLKRRAVLLTGTDPATRPADLAPDVLAVDYAPFSGLFPHAAAVVHQCGVGTTGQGMRSGRPVLAVPFALDQPDNAERVRRLGVARVLPRHRYTAKRAAAELERLLAEPSYVSRSSEVGRQIRDERGVEAACHSLLEFIQAGMLAV